MFIKDSLPHHIAINVAGRVLFMSLFVLSGITHFTNIPYYVSLMPESFPYPLFCIFLSGVIELAGAAMILLNWCRHADYPTRRITTRHRLVQVSE